MGDDMQSQLCVSTDFCCVYACDEHAIIRKLHRIVNNRSFYRAGGDHFHGQSHVWIVSDDSDSQGH